MKILAVLFMLAAAATTGTAQSPDCANFGCDLAPQGCASCHFLWQWCNPSYPFCNSCDSNCRGIEQLSPEERTKLAHQQAIRAISNPSSLNDAWQIIRMVDVRLTMLDPVPAKGPHGMRLPIGHPLIGKSKPCVVKRTVISLVR